MQVSNDVRCNGFQTSYYYIRSLTVGVPQRVFLSGPLHRQWLHLPSIAFYFLLFLIQIYPLVPLSKLFKLALFSCNSSLEASTLSRQYRWASQFHYHNHSYQYQHRRQLLHPQLLHRTYFQPHNKWIQRMVRLHYLSDPLAQFKSFCNMLTVTSLICSNNRSLPTKFVSAFPLIEKRTKKITCSFLYTSVASSEHYWKKQRFSKECCALPSIPYPRIPRRPFYVNMVDQRQLLWLDLLPKGRRCTRWDSLIDCIACWAIVNTPYIFLYAFDIKSLANFCFTLVKL